MIINRTLFFLGMVFIVTGCSVNPPVASTVTPTWDYSAPTLAPTSNPLFLPPTEIPPDVNLDSSGQSNPQAAALPWDSEIPPIIVENLGGGEKTVQLTLQDGSLLSGMLYENMPVQAEDGLIVPRLPGVLLIGEPGEQWGDFPRLLNDSGFIVLVVDMATYGTTSEFIDVLRSFSRSRTVDSALMGVIGANEGADEALIGCAIDDICDTVILLSPLNRDTLANVIVDFNPRPMFAVASREDVRSFETVSALESMMSSASIVTIYDGIGYGAEMLINQPDLSAVIIAWLQEKLVDEWRINN